MSTHRFSRLPIWISHWLGYRTVPPIRRPNYVIWFWSFIGAFGGLSILQAVFGHAHYFIGRKVPTIIASYGASAVLCYGAIEAPLAQPRALIGGHFIAAIIGVCIAKLFRLSSHFESLRWLASSLATSIAIVVMQMMATTHPPAGATALLAVVNDDVLAIGWYYLPVILLSSTLVLVSALLINNIQRRYPMYWLEPAAPCVAGTTTALEQKNMPEDNETMLEEIENQVEAEEVAQDRV